jgi:hypothetical protein
VIDRNISAPNWGVGTVSSFLPGRFPRPWDHCPNRELGLPLLCLRAGTLRQPVARLIAYPVGCPKSALFLFGRVIGIRTKRRSNGGTCPYWEEACGPRSGAGFALTWGLRDSAEQLARPRRVRRDNRPARVPTGSRHCTGANDVFTDGVDCPLGG